MGEAMALRVVVGDSLALQVSLPLLLLVMEGVGVGDGVTPSVREAVPAASREGVRERGSEGLACSLCTQRAPMQNRAEV